MNILYGLSGEGFGHSSRALIIIPYLLKKGHKVKIFTSGKGEEVLGEKFDVNKIYGTKILFDHGRVKKRSTVYYNLKNFPKNFINWGEVKKMVEDFKPDLCITDYEPFTYLVAQRFRIPIISIGNHQIMSHVKLKFPKRHLLNYLLIRLVTLLHSPSADHSIIFSFLEAKPKKDVFIVPPVIRNAVKRAKPSDRGKVLVYLNNADYVVDILKKIDEKFVVYGFDKNEIDGNIQFRTRDHFLRDLVKARAIIATSGFTLLSEAVYLKKPYFAVPQRGQFEQLFNALTVKKLGFGEYSENPSEKQISSFLKNIKVYKKSLKNYRANFDEVYNVLDSILQQTLKRKNTY